MGKREIDPNACPKTGIVGQHQPSCYTIVRNCGKHEHTHSANCYFQSGKNEGQLKCILAEHTHSPAAPCYQPSGPNCGGV